MFSRNLLWAWPPMQRDVFRTGWIHHSGWRLQLGTLVLVWFSLASNELSAQEVNPQAAEIARIEAELASLDQQHAQLQQELLQARRQATDPDRNWKDLLGQIQRIRSERTELGDQLKAQRKKSADALQQEEAAAKAVAQAQQTLKEAQQQLAEADKLIGELERQLSALPVDMSPLEQAAQDAEKISIASHKRIDKVESQATALERRRREYQQQIESLLRDSGQWVSFSDQIAPIFQQRCIACHNARNAKGRYNMANYAMIMAAGESGPAIHRGSADDSLLLDLIADGAMPLDADPLSDAEVSLIRRWIDSGARLDHDADPLAPLIQLAPRLPQPAAPRRYLATIPITALAIDPQGTTLASGGYHELLLWSLADWQAMDSGAPVRPRRIGNVAQRVYSLAFHPDGRRLAVAAGTPGEMGEVKLFDVRRGKLIADLVISEDVMFSVAFSPDGNRLAAGGADGTITIFPIKEWSSADISPKTLRPLIIDDHSDWVQSIAWSPDGKSLVSASRDNTVKVFDAETGAGRLTYSDHKQPVFSVVFLSDHQHVASVGADRSIQIWELATGKKTSQISGLPAETSHLKLLGDDRLVSIGSDKRVQIHSPRDGKTLRAAAVGMDWASSLAISPDLSHAAIGDQAGNVSWVHLDQNLEVERTWLALPR